MVLFHLPRRPDGSLPRLVEVLKVSDCVEVPVELTFSILHATKRLPHGWRNSWTEFLEQADRPEVLEYLLCVDREDVSRERIEVDRFLINDGRACPVDAWNFAARQSVGTVLIIGADDLFPCEHWDTQILEAIGDLSKPAVLWVDVADNNPDLITHPIVTRAWYEQPGRGGMPHGEFFYPDYFSMGCDDELTEYAHRDGVVIDARETIHWRHEHWTVNPKVAYDRVYQNTESQAAFDIKDAVLARRRACGFSK